MTNRDTIMEALTRVPGLPVAATEVLRLVQDQDTGISEIMAAVEHDPGLTADVLRLANSAYFAGPREVASLRDAGVLFGTNRLMQIVITSAVCPVAKQEVRGYGLPSGGLLRHLSAVAIGAETMAKALGKQAPTYAFTAGLLHDLGKIVLGTFLEVDGDAIMKTAEEEGCSFEAAERHVLGTDHAEVGAALLELWELPAQVVEVARWHHEPDRVEGDSLAVDLVHAVDILSIECGLGVGIDGLQYRPSPAVVERLGLKQKVAEHVTCEMLGLLDEVAPRPAQDQGE